MLRAVVGVLVCASLAAATQEEMELAGRQCHLSRPRDAEVTGALIWLHRRDEDPVTDLRWWHRSGLVDRGLAVLVPRYTKSSWDEQRDRFPILHLDQAAQRLLNLPPGRLLIGGHGDGAALAQRLIMGLPERYAGAVLARGLASGHWPEGRAGQRPVLGIFANHNDPHLPLRSLEQAAGRIDPDRFAVLWARSDGEAELTPALWALTAEIAAAANLPLRPARTDAELVLPSEGATADTSPPSPTDQQPAR